MPRNAPSVFSLMTTLFLSQAAPIAFAATAVATPMQPPPPPAEPAVVTAPEPASTGAASPATTQDVMQLRDNLQGLTAALQKDIAAVRPSWWERLVPAGLGLLGVLVGGWVSWRLQSRQLRLSAQLHQQQLREAERMGRAKVAFEALSKVIDYQSKQVNEFYSPLRLMLRRSSGVRRQLTDQLHAKDSTRYVYLAEADGRDHLFVIASDGAQTRFRLIEHMHELATQNAELMPLVREIVNIGVAITSLIDSKGGLALNESDHLNTLLGRYLAHFSILRDVADKADKNPALLATLQYNVAYPIELDGILDKDMRRLTDQIDVWKQSSEQMWADASLATATG